MSKKKRLFDIQIEQPLLLVNRTIVHYFTRDTKVEYSVDITSDIIYLWLGQMNVANTTKLTRLKCFKAFLGRCFDNRWLANRFWRSVNIKVDTEIKIGASDEDVKLVYSIGFIKGVMTPVSTYPLSTFYTTPKLYTPTRGRVGLQHYKEGFDSSTPLLEVYWIFMLK